MEIFLLPADDVYALCWAMKCNPTLKQCMSKPVSNLENTQKSEVCRP